MSALLFAVLLAPPVQAGDLVFHTSRSTQSRAIQLATGSPYSHMGLVLERDGELVVLEASATVRFTPLETWKRRGEPESFAVRRLRRPLDAAALARVEAAANPLLGKPYDAAFDWSDERMYCSELVWKVLERALGIRVGALKKLGAFDLDQPLVKKTLRARYGEGIPRDAPVIAPSDMYASPALREP